MKTAEEWADGICEDWRVGLKGPLESAVADGIAAARAEVVEELVKECEIRGEIVSYKLDYLAFARVVRAWWRAQQERAWWKAQQEEVPQKAPRPEHKAPRPEHDEPNYGTLIVSMLCMFRGDSKWITDLPVDAVNEDGIQQVLANGGELELRLVSTATPLAAEVSKAVIRVAGAKYEPRKHQPGKNKAQQEEDKDGK